MSFRHELSGRRFGKWLVVGEAPHREKHGRICWDLVCDCGVKAVRFTQQLVSGQSKGCGCDAGKEKILDLTGHRYNLLTVVSRDRSKDHLKNGSHWLCACVCGNTRVVPAGSIRSGNVKSCVTCAGTVLRRDRLAAKWRAKRRLFVGKQYGDLTILSLYRRRRATANGAHPTMALCSCACGTRGVRVFLLALKNKTTSSCGCWVRQGRNQPRGPAHHAYDPEIPPEKRGRRKWHLDPDASEAVFRSGVFRRDRYLCMACGDQSQRYLTAHHIKPWHAYEAQRSYLRNGVTLCRKCHMSFHSAYGFKNKDMWKQFVPWIRARRKETGFVKS